MTPLDLAEKIEADRRADVPGGVCTLDRCVCPTCAVTATLLRAKLRDEFTAVDATRVTIRANDFAGGAYPCIASVRVDGREVYRITHRPDEVFDSAVMDDIRAALRRKEGT